jgi:hypothetical protein
MTTQHTPGPWKAVRASHGVVDIFDNNDHDIVTLFGCNREANARLIAAAPELLAVLQDLLGVLEHVSLESGICCCGDNIANHDHPMNCGHSPVDSGTYYGDMAIAAAEKVVAKATGEQL